MFVSAAVQTVTTMPTLIEEACVVLGLPPSTSPPPAEDVTKAFKPLAVLWHPDKNIDRVEVTLRLKV